MPLRQIKLTFFITHKNQDLKEAVLSLISLISYTADGLWIVCWALSSADWRQACCCQLVNLVFPDYCPMAGEPCSQALGKVTWRTQSGREGFFPSSERDHVKGRRAEAQKKRSLSLCSFKTKLSWRLLGLIAALLWPQRFDLVLKWGYVCPHSLT